MTLCRRGRRISPLFLLVLTLLFVCWANADENGANLDQIGDKYDDTVSKTALEEENGILVLMDVEDISVALHPDLGDPVLLLLAVCSPICPHCPSFLAKLETVANSISQLSLEKPPLFAKLDGTLLDAAYLEEQLGVTSYPTLVFVRGYLDEFTAIDYIGLQETWEDIYETVLHYWYRCTHQPTAVISLENVTQLDSWVQLHGPLAVRHLLPPLNPSLTEEERDHIRWLMEDDEKEEPFVFFVQCNTEDKRYLELSEIMGVSRDVLFFSVRNCTGLYADTTNDMVHLSMVVSPPQDWKSWKDHMRTKWLSDKSELEQFVVQMTTPSILWYERKSVAPIAFPTWRKVHAVLFVDTNDSKFSKDAIQQFRRVCRSQRIGEDMVCLIVPQTERRILTTFGVDLWTPLDRLATEGGPIQPVLPTLCITDQRYGGTRKFYLNATTILTVPLAMHDFIGQFWNKELTPAMLSSDRAPRTIKSGVQVLTAASFQEAIQTERKHTLIYFFAPSCGHCKRFSILWNKLAQLVRHMKWNTVLDIAKMDVTTNEIITLDFVLDVDAVPAVYYFGSDKMQPVRYDIADEFGDNAGRLSDPLDIVEWLLDVSDFDEAELLSLLQDTNKDDKVSKQQNDDL